MTDTAIRKQNLAMFDRLTSDILFDIFKYFSQKDCLQCMQICHDWYNVVPTYAHNVWSTINVKGTRRFSWQTLWLEFVGEHVKELTFTNWKERGLYTMMQKLLDRGCNNLRFIRFERCNTANQARFLPLLIQLGAHVTDMEMELHMSNVAFLDVLEACPQLARFSFIFPSSHAYSMYGLYNIEPNIVTNDTWTSYFLSSNERQQIWEKRPILHGMKGMVLDAALEKKTRLEPILRKCPNLWHLVCSNGVGKTREETIIPSYDTTLIDLDDLFTWCPKLISLELNTDQGREANRLCADFHDFFFKDRAQRLQNPMQGLQYFMTYEGEDYGAERIGPLLVRHAPSLKYLTLARAVGTVTPHQDWSFIFQSFDTAPCLNTLVLKSLTYQSSALTSLLQHCPNLQKLIIENSLLMPFDLSKNLRALPQLKYLELDNVSLQLDDDLDGGSIVRLFQHLANEKGNKRSCLEDIRFNSVPEVTHDFLIAATYIPTMKKIKTFLDSRYYTDEGLLIFGERLCRTSIESLDLGRIRALPHDFLCLLGDLPSLKSIYIQASYQPNGVLVDGLGLGEMLYKSNSLESVFIDEATVGNSNKLGNQEQVDKIYEKYEMPFGIMPHSRLIFQRRIHGKDNNNNNSQPSIFLL
ncbi:hypothetical protein BDA99DRAFT_542886 [Phascolomyces articulosus]|uniref:F-box domain-containing protein n=1 Tax=Phascolomyces articulosus TaxID=60185 RepID=A0AAD5JZU8_9FUNG|nr:hypothetical protein BDA99DRAFT_542886 [Phascolomyces articulosus]